MFKKVNKKVSYPCKVCYTYSIGIFEENTTFELEKRREKMIKLKYSRKNKITRVSVLQPKEKCAFDLLLI